MIVQEAREAKGSKWRSETFQTCAMFALRCQVCSVPISAIHSPTE
ncbi:hypothetical protein PAMC26577_13950 [Caballeronia sordidicola]|uniref:Uncharacterized protein n=1 Tax=Caballeronia sordidicola TaxID=196367 RepID=A0A242MUG6_CABSO|nr:hypothetical protein PAMC26577_13950 [Caballeronia sordidicola]